MPFDFEALNPLSETSIVSTGLHSLWNNSWMNQPLVNDHPKNTTKPSKVIQSMRCEVCKIDCNSRDVLEKHALGKRHKRNLQMQIASTAIAVDTYGIIQNGSLGQMISGASGVAVGELETEKQKLMEGGAPVDSVLFCTICNVACNSQVMLNKHLTGRKHAAQATARLLSWAGPYDAANPNPISLISPPVQSHDNSMQRTGPKKAKIVQSAWCKVCKIHCNSYDVLSKHNLGKKHLKNLEKSKNPNATPASNAAPITTPIIGPMENPDASKGNTLNLQKSKRKATRSQAPEEDLETKRRKIMEDGAAAGAVRVCTVCSVVCNSQTVFNSHLAGQKHAAMVKKQAEAGMVTPGHLVVTAV